jgi:uroporphyrinogen decarboxylase
MERIQAVINGEELDIPPISMWRHFFREEPYINKLTEALIGFQRQFNWDFAKINPRANFMVEDWGVKDNYYDNDYKAPETVDWPVKSISDWNKIEPLNPQKGVLGEHLVLLNTISNNFKGDVPLLMTLFTPLSIAGRLAGNDSSMKTLLNENPKIIHQILEIITQTFIEFSEECLNAGASGLFYATTHWGTYNNMTDQEYNEFGRPYDLKLLNALPKSIFNILHVCQSNNMLRSLSDYPVQAFNWDTREPSNLSLKEGHQITGKVVIGGLGQKTTLPNGTTSDVIEEINDSRLEMCNKNWILGPGCTFSPETPEENLRVLRTAF